MVVMILLRQPLKAGSMKLYVYFWRPAQMKVLLAKHGIVLNPATLQLSYQSKQGAFCFWAKMDISEFG
jgi:hypothetical protein